MLKQFIKASKSKKLEVLQLIKKETKITALDTLKIFCGMFTLLSLIQTFTNGG